MSAKERVVYIDLDLDTDLEMDTDVDEISEDEEVDQIVVKRIDILSTEATTHSRILTNGEIKEVEEDMNRLKAELRLNQIQQKSSQTMKKTKTRHKSEVKSCEEITDSNETNEQINEQIVVLNDTQIEAMITRFIKDIRNGFKQNK